MQTISLNTFTSLEVVVFAIAIIGFFVMMVIAVEYFEKRRNEKFSSIIRLAHELKIDTTDIKNLTALKLLQEKIGTANTLEFLSAHFISTEE